MILPMLLSAFIPPTVPYYPLDEEAQESCMDIISMYVYVGLDEKTRIEWIQETLNYFVKHYNENNSDYQLDD